MNAASSRVSFQRGPEQYEGRRITPRARKGGDYGYEFQAFENYSLPSRNGFAFDIEKYGVSVLPKEIAWCTVGEISSTKTPAFQLDRLYDGLRSPLSAGMVLSALGKKGVASVVDLMPLHILFHIEVLSELLRFLALSEGDKVRYIECVKGAPRRFSNPQFNLNNHLDVPALDVSLSLPSVADAKVTRALAIQRVPREINFDWRLFSNSRHKEVEIVKAKFQKENPELLARYKEAHPNEVEQAQRLVRRYEEICAKIDAMKAVFRTQPDKIAITLFRDLYELYTSWQEGKLRNDLCEIEISMNSFVYSHNKNRAAVPKNFLFNGIQNLLQVVDYFTGRWTKASIEEKAS
jgi:hypothetical protein